MIFKINDKSTLLEFIVYYFFADHFWRWLFQFPFRRCSVPASSIFHCRCFPLLLFGSPIFWWTLRTGRWGWTRGLRIRGTSAGWIWPDWTLDGAILRGWRLIKPRSIDSGPIDTKNLKNSYKLMEILFYSHRITKEFTFVFGNELFAIILFRNECWSPIVDQMPPSLLFLSIFLVIIYANLDGCSHSFKNME